jgi:RNA recognition motif-containing protein
LFSEKMRLNSAKKINTKNVINTSDWATSDLTPENSYSLRTPTSFHPCLEVSFMPVRLYVGNLPKELVDRQDLQNVFAESGDLVSTKIIKDRKTGKCRGFGFVTVETEELADQIIQKYDGHMFQESALKIERAEPRSKDKPEGDESASQEGSTPAPQGASNNRPQGGNGAPSRRSNKKSRRPATSGSSSSSSGDSFQPDPRWADELAKLKEMLAAQASNS